MSAISTKEIEVTTKQTIYVCSDGTEWDSKFAAVEHEQKQPEREDLVAALAASPEQDKRLRRICAIDSYSYADEKDCDIDDLLETLTAYNITFGNIGRFYESNGANDDDEAVILQQIATGIEKCDGLSDWELHDLDSDDWRNPLKLQVSVSIVR